MSSAHETFPTSAVILKNKVSPYLKSLDKELKSQAQYLLNATCISWLPG